MEWWVILSGSLFLLLAVFVSGAPLFVGFLLVNLVTVVLIAGTRGFILVANSIFESATISALTAIPLFILMGEILTHSGSVENLFRGMDGLIGRVRGRQYVLTILISVVFGALSGAAMAVAAMLGRSLYPTMVQRKYDPALSIGAIMAGASLAPIIPPSVLIVVVATLADVSIGKLLISGIGPGLVAALIFLDLHRLSRAGGTPACRPTPTRPTRARGARQGLRRGAASAFLDHRLLRHGPDPARHRHAVGGRRLRRPRLDRRCHHLPEVQLRHAARPPSAAPRPSPP